MSDPLRQRYAGPRMVRIWSDSNRWTTERMVWVKILQHQVDAGADWLGSNPQAVVDDYTKHIAGVNPARISVLEARTLHEVKARIEHFNEQAGHQAIHVGMTGRDVTENVEMRLVADSFLALHGRLQAVIYHLCRLAEHHADTTIAARTHGVPAQPTLLGLRFAGWAEQLIEAIDSSNYIRVARGVKGAVGNLGDMIGAIGLEAAEQLDEELVEQLLGDDFSTWIVTGQSYPRVVDASIANVLQMLAAPVREAALGVRLMVTQGLAGERNVENQVGSTSMPHKSNPRFAERVHGLGVVLDGYTQMLRASAGHTWLEGDVSDTSTRRIALPGVFMALDGLLRSAVRSLLGFTAHCGAIARELTEWKVPLMSGQRMLQLVHEGVGREDAHRRVSALDGPQVAAIHNASQAWPGGKVGPPELSTGAARRQIEMVLDQAEDWLVGYVPDNEQQPI